MAILKPMFGANILLRVFIIVYSSKLNIYQYSNKPCVARSSCGGVYKMDKCTYRSYRVCLDNLFGDIKCICMHSVFGFVSSVKVLCSTS